MNTNANLNFEPSRGGTVSAAPANVFRWKTLPQVAACVATMLVGTPDIASAGVVTTGNYYEDSRAASCSSATLCRLTMTLTPAAKMVTVTRLSCLVITTAPLQSMFLAVTPSVGGAISRDYYLQPHLTSYSGTQYFYTVDQEIGFLYGPSRHPTIVTSTGKSSTGPVHCSLIGTITKQ